MKLSAKTYYAMRALAFLAKTEKSFSTREIAKKEKLPYEYLEKIFQTLRRAGFVDSQRGTDGGYRLAVKPNDITLGEILAELEGPFFSLPCFSTKGCARSKNCQTKTVWDTVNQKLDEQLEAITLSDILK